MGDGDRLEQGAHFVEVDQAAERGGDAGVPLRQAFRPRPDAETFEKLALADGTVDRRTGEACRTCDLAEVDMRGDVCGPRLDQGRPRLVRSNRLEGAARPALRRTVVDQQGDSPWLSRRRARRSTTAIRAGEISTVVPGSASSRLGGSSG